MGREQESDVHKTLENREQTDEVITFSPALNVWGGEEASLAEPQTILACGARWVGCKPYKEEHILRFSSSPHEKKISTLFLITPLPPPLCQYGELPCECNDGGDGSGRAHSPSPLVFEHTGSQASGLQHQNQNPILSFYCETHQEMSSAPTWGFPQLWNASLLSRTREPRTKAIWGKP